MIPLVAGRPVTRKRWVHGVGTAMPRHSRSSRRPRRARARVGAPRRHPALRRAEGLPDRGRPGDPRVARPAGGARAARAAVAVRRARASRANPDRIVFDLDPGAGIGLAECAEVARLVRDLLAGMGLELMPGDERQQGHPPLRGARRVADLRLGIGCRAGARPGARGRPSRARRVEHAQDAAHGQGAHRLEPEQRQEDHDRARTRCAAGRARRSPHRARGRSSTIRDLRHLEASRGARPGRRRATTRCARSRRPSARRAARRRTSRCARPATHARAVPDSTWGCGDRVATATRRGSSSRSTTPGACTSTCGSSATACS